MDFLTKYDAMMDCKSKVVSLRNGDSITKFQGQGWINEKKWVFTLKADKMLRIVAYGYLAHIQEKIEALVGIKDVIIVKEFRDVFPKELPRLSHQRDVEFSIEIVSEESPISIPPYKMAPTELRELKI